MVGLDGMGVWDVRSPVFDIAVDVDDGCGKISATAVLGPSKRDVVYCSLFTSIREITSSFGVEGSI